MLFNAAPGTGIARANAVASSGVVLNAGAVVSHDRRIAECCDAEPRHGGRDQAGSAAVDIDRRTDLLYAQRRRMQGMHRACCYRRGSGEQRPLGQHQDQKDC